MHTGLEQGRLGLGSVFVPRRRKFSLLVVGVSVVGVGLVGTLQSHVGVVGAVVVVGCRYAPWVMVGGQVLVLVEALPSTHIQGLSFSVS